MGHIRTIPQTTQDGKKTSQTSIEITYGGNEAPFGGLDTSKPAAYIDPRCFAQSDGFLVVDNRICLASLSLLTLPTLWTGVQAVPLKFGNYFDSVLGQLNYALGVVVTSPGGPPLYWNYQFYLTIWNPINNIKDNQTLQVKLWQNYLKATYATLTVPVIMGEASNYTDSGTVGIDYGNGGVFGGTVTVPYAPGATVASIVSALVTALNAVSGSTGFTAAATTDGLGITFTATTIGVAGNSLQIGDNSGSSTMGDNPAFYIPIPGRSVAWTNLSGGAAVTFQTPPTTFSNVQATAVGGVLYFANLGPMILKYQALGQFNISTLYNGVKVLKKFAGSLIGLGVIPQLGMLTQNANMIFAWSAANNLDEWSPVTASGNVTGAGFAQLADVDDALTGLIVTNNTAFILRAQGISYATAVGSGSSPFQFAHISLGDNGEGAQNPAFVAQYDQVGAFLGNTEVYKVTGAIAPIGQKITSLLFTDYQASGVPVGADITPSYIGGDSYSLLIFQINQNLYCYNFENGTWMFFSVLFPGPQQLFLATLVSYLSPAAQLIYSSVNFLYKTTPSYSIQAYELVEGTNTSTISNPPRITFPQEELFFGRDVTIDAIYIALNAQVTGTVALKFFFGGVLFNSTNLNPATFNSLSVNAIEMQIFPISGVFTSHSPQLQIQVQLQAGATVTGLRISKIQLYGCFDPEQRPV